MSETEQLSQVRNPIWTLIGRIGELRQELDRFVVPNHESERRLTSRIWYLIGQIWRVYEVAWAELDTAAKLIEKRSKQSAFLWLVESRAKLYRFVSLIVWTNPHIITAFKQFDRHEREKEEFTKQWIEKMRDPRLRPGHPDYPGGAKWIANNQAYGERIRKNNAWFENWVAEIHIHGEGLLRFLEDKNWRIRYDNSLSEIELLSASVNAVFHTSVSPPQSTPPTTSTSSVILNESNYSASVLGKVKMLTFPRFKLIRAMLEHRPGGMTKDEIENVVPSARNILTALRHDPEWKVVIQMPGPLS